MRCADIIGAVVNEAREANEARPTGKELPGTLPLFKLDSYDEQLKVGQKWTRDFSVLDQETPVEKLKVTATSDNQAPVPDANIQIESGELKG